MSGWLWLLVSSAFVAGLAGGVHCAAMCGGIVAASTSRTATGRFDWRRALCFNAGRVASYALAGTIAGALGQAGLAIRGGAPAHHLMLLVAGVAMLIIALYIGGVTRVARALEAVGGVLWRYLQPYTRAFLPADTPARAAGLGVLWGWLPCGMVYAVLLTAAATMHAGHGALVMLAFGIGTLPNLLAAALAAQRLRAPLARPASRIAAGAIVGVLGLTALAGASGAHLFWLESFFCAIAGSGATH